MLLFCSFLRKKENFFLNLWTQFAAQKVVWTFSEMAWPNVATIRSLMTKTCAIPCTVTSTQSLGPRGPLWCHTPKTRALWRSFVFSCSPAFLSTKRQQTGKHTEWVGLWWRVLHHNLHTGVIHVVSHNMASIIPTTHAQSSRPLIRWPLKRTERVLAWSISTYAVTHAHNVKLNGGNQDQTNGYSTLTATKIIASLRCKREPYSGRITLVTMTTLIPNSDARQIIPRPQTSGSAVICKNMEILNTV